MKDLIRSFWYFTCKVLIIYIPDKLFYRLMFCITNFRLGFLPYWLDLKHPRTFNEKINWIKFNERPLNGMQLADKVLVRDFVEKKVGSKYLIPLIGVYNAVEDIDFDFLPEKFALKTNHGSGWNVICHNKRDLKLIEIKTKLRKWLRYNSYFLSREWQYKSIIPKLICEQFLEYNIFDYKFFCFDGRPTFVQLDIDRFTNHTRSFYDIKWNKKDFGINYKISDKVIEKPDCLDEMIEVAKKLSEGLKFARIDLYIHEGNIYFGEITLHPGGGFEPFLSKEQDVFMGGYLVL